MSFLSGPFPERIGGGPPDGVFGKPDLSDEAGSKGYWAAPLKESLPGLSMATDLEEDTERPDPASHSQPMGVHGPSEVVDHTAYAWGDQDWRGIPPGDGYL